MKTAKTAEGHKVKKNPATIGYQALNLLCHATHLAVVAFLVFGWIFPATRPYHLALILLTLGSWVWFGYCPLTEAQWRVRKHLGLPDNSGPYIPFLVRKLYHGPVDSGKIDRAVTAFSGMLALLSLGLALTEFFRHPHFQHWPGI